MSAGCVGRHSARQWSRGHSFPQDLGQPAHGHRLFGHLCQGGCAVSARRGIACRSCQHCLMHQVTEGYSRFMRKFAASRDACTQYRCSPAQCTLQFETLCLCSWYVDLPMLLSHAVCCENCDCLTRCSSNRTACDSGSSEEAQGSGICNNKTHSGSHASDLAAHD